MKTIYLCLFILFYSTYAICEQIDLSYHIDNAGSGVIEVGTLDGGTTADKEVVMSEECVFRAKFDRQSGALIAFYDFMEIYQNEPDYIDLTTQPLDIIHNNDVSIYSLDLDINLNKSWIDIITPKVCKANEKISFFKLSLFMGKKWTAIRWSAHCLNGHLQLNQRFRQLKCTF